MVDGFDSPFAVAIWGAFLTPEGFVDHFGCL
jgi:hypothetical protein